MSSQGGTDGMGRARALTKDEVVEFLAGPIVARMAMVKPDGTPYVVPLWQEYDGEAQYFIVRARALFVPYIKVNARVCVSCALDVAPNTRVTLEGNVELAEGPKPLEGSMLDIVRRMSLRYLGEHGPEYLEATRNRPRYLLKLVPASVVSWEGTEWHSRYLTND